MAERFTGFPPESLEFFRELAAHNNRDWFLAHKDVYQRACRGPMEALDLAHQPRHPVLPRQGALQDVHRRRRGRELHLPLCGRPLRRRRILCARRRCSPAFPGGGRRRHDGTAPPGDRQDAAAPRLRSRLARDAVVRAAGLFLRSPADRAAEDEGPLRGAAVRSRRLVGDGEGAWAHRPRDHRHRAAGQVAAAARHCLDPGGGVSPPRRRSLAHQLLEGAAEGRFRITR